MRVTIIHRYFWPDNAPYAQMLFKIAAAIKESGADVDVISTQPSHSWDAGRVNSHETVKGVRIRRLSLLPESGRKLALRGINTVLFAIQVFFLLIFKRTDVVMIASTPPVVMAAVVRYAAMFKKFKYIYHCQDIHPEAMNIIGAVKKNLLFKVAQRVDIKNVQHAAKVVVLSDDMKETLVRRGDVAGNIEIINNFIFDGKLPNDMPDLSIDSKFNLLFAGNLGRFQNLELIVDAAKLLVDEVNINFIFVGDGVSKSKLVDRSGDALDRTIHFKGHVSLESALAYMDWADLGIISISKGVIQVAYPSKTMMYLSRGLPVLALVEASDLSRYVEEHKLGIVCSDFSPEVLANEIKTAFKSKQLLNEIKSEIAEFAQKEFGAETVLLQWKELFVSVLDES